MTVPPLLKIYPRGDETPLPKVGPPSILLLLNNIPIDISKQREIILFIAQSQNPTFITMIISLLLCLKRQTLAGVFPLEPKLP